MDTAIINYFLGITGCLVVIVLGDRLGLSDIPNHRSSHCKSVPKGAGIGILAAAIVASMKSHIPLYIWGPTLFISVVSLFGGDLQGLSSTQRLVCHFIAAFFFLFFYAIDSNVPGSNLIMFVPLSVFIVGTANFYNFMDGIDGMAGITGVVGFLLAAVYGTMKGAVPIPPIFCVAVAASCTGFLCFNLPRAKVFLGDAGSILLGFLFACIVIAASRDILDFVVLTGFLFPYYFDEILTMGVRIRTRETLLRPHRKHLYQLLANELSVPHWKISTAYGTTQLLIGISLMGASHKGISMVLSVYAIFGVLLSVLAMWIHLTAKPMTTSTK